MLTSRTFSRSVPSASVKMLASTWLPICASDGGSSDSPGVVRVPVRAAPTTRMRSAPRCSAGAVGAICRIAPSPKYSLPIGVGGNTNGIALDASRCGTPIAARTPMRCERSHSSIPGPPMQKLTDMPVW